MDEEAKLLIEELKSLKLFDIIKTHSLGKIDKSLQVSADSRKEGNQLYLKQHHTALGHFEILSRYSKSMAFAPLYSEDLARSYGNRSALLMHLKKYDECIQDVDRALEITLDADLREKLSDRRKQCVQLLDLLRQVEERKAEIDKKNSVVITVEGFPNVYLNDDSLLSKKDLQDSVTIKYDEKYGRYLVANRDFSPGEIIFNEKSYVNSFNTQCLYTHCGHCLTMTWSGIPCDHCAWFVYCSEKCKKEAWEQYHEIECCCIFHIMFLTENIGKQMKEKISFDGLTIRAIIKGVREAGSFDKLKEQLNNVDTSEDKCTKGFLENGKFDSSKFISLYSLSSCTSENEIKSLAKFAAITLFSLVKFTNFFDDDFQPFSDTDLISNEDAIFIGSLILRLSKISSINSHAVYNITDQCKYSNDTATCLQNWCCIKGTCFVPIASLTNHSCNPNARRCFTDDQRFILYAVQPIKKDTQIFDSYYCSYYEFLNPLRKHVLKKNFNFECDCIACENNWPCYSVFQNCSKKLPQTFKYDKKEKDLWNEFKHLIQSVQNKTTEFDQVLLLNISRATKKSMSLPQPSFVHCKFMYTLIQVFEKIYGYNTQLSYDC